MKKKNTPQKSQKKNKQVVNKKKTEKLSLWQKFAFFGTGSAGLAKAIEIFWNLWM
ncbi:hypothetical protein [Bacillus cereus group sp. IBL03679]|uniref:hypothetical protein n=1 Tax=Bacillus cereus group sp. IBL03679 TaxID=3240095 RepID=UPI003D2F6FAA